MGEAWVEWGNKQSTAPLPPTPALCPESSCAPRVGDRGRSGSRGAAPGPPLLIGPWRRQQPGRHAPGRGRADKACQGTHDLQLRNPSGSHHHSSGRGPPWSFSSASRRKQFTPGEGARLLLSRTSQPAEELSYPLLLDTDGHAPLYSFEPGELGNN